MTSAQVGELRDLWTGLEEVAAGARQFRAQRLRSNALVAMYAGLREPDAARSLIFEGPISLAPRGRTSFAGEGISFSEQRAPNEGVYRVHSTLEGPHFAGPFEALCGDLIDVAEAATSSGVGLADVARRMSVWMASLRRRSALSDEAVRGLIGELACLEVVAEAIGWAAAVDAWTGPDDGLHDITAGGGAWEVKASTGAGSSVWINGLDQLDDTGLAGLVLAHVHMVPDPGGHSLRMLAQRLRGQIASHSPGGLAEFERKLIAAGHLGAEPSAEVPYRIAAISHFAVADMFPRILRSDVSLGIEEARYQLRTAALQPFAIDTPRALATVTG